MARHWFGDQKVVDMIQDANMRENWIVELDKNLAKLKGEHSSSFLKYLTLYEEMEDYKKPNL